MSSAFLCVIVVLSVLASVQAFVTPRVQDRRTLQKPLQENFFIELETLNDPSKVTPGALLGEAKYKDFVGSFDKDALLLNEKPFATSGPAYDLIDRVRSLKLLSLTADSGLLEALEDKGITLSQIEKILPIVDDLGLLPLVAQNKNLLLSLAPLIIESSPSVIPLAASVLRTPASTFTGLGALAASLGAYEASVGGNGLMGVPLTLLGAPLLVLGTCCGSGELYRAISLCYK